MNREIGVVVAGVTGDFLPDPWREEDLLISPAKLHLGDDESGVLPLKFIHLPNVTLKGNLKTVFLNDRSFAELKKLPGILQGNGIFKFRPGDSGDWTFDSEKSPFSGNPDSDRAARSA